MSTPTFLVLLVIRNPPCQSLPVRRGEEEILSDGLPLGPTVPVYAAGGIKSLPYGVKWSSALHQRPLPH